MYILVAGFLCVVGGAVGAALLIGMPWTLAVAKLRFFWQPWMVFTWITALLGTLALLGYGVALLTSGAASLAAIFFYMGFIISFTVSVVAATRLLQLRYSSDASSLRAHLLALGLLVVYVALVYFWLAGTLLAALTPLIAMVLATGAILGVRRNSHVVNNPTPLARPTHRRDVIYWFMLLFASLGPLVDWILCTVGARDVVWPLFVLVHIVAIVGYPAALPTD